MPGYLITKLTFSVHIVDAVGNIVNYLDANEAPSKTLAAGIKTINGKTGIVINWSNQNSNGRNVGSGAYLAIIRIMGDAQYANEYLAKISVGAFK